MKVKQLQNACNNLNNSRRLLIEKHNVLKDRVVRINTRHAKWLQEHLEELHAIPGKDTVNAKPYLDDIIFYMDRPVGIITESRWDEDYICIKVDFGNFHKYLDLMDVEEMG